MYFQKLIHRANDKLSARSIGPYSSITLQPLGGKSRHGGHRLGEMEIYALLAHGAEKLTKDFITIHSDSPGLKDIFFSNILNNPDILDMETLEKRPQSLVLLQTYFKLLGVELCHE
jgi:DNA-directed RNA polymerase subunit beta